MGEHHAQTQRPIRVCLMTFVNYLRRRPKRKFVVICQAVLVLTCQVDDARLAVVTGPSKLRCISCPMSLCHAKSARARGTTATRLTLRSKVKMSRIFWTCLSLTQLIFSPTSREFRVTCKRLSTWVLAMFDSGSLRQLFLEAKRSA